MFDNNFIIAIIVGIVIVIAATPIGFFLINRKMSLVTDAMGHAILPGAALGAMIGHSDWAILAGATITGIILFTIAAKMPKISTIGEDTNFAIFYLGALSAGLLIAAADHEHVHLDELLFGNILEVSQETLIFCVVVCVITLIAMKLIYKPLMLDTIDSDYSFGLRSARIAKQIFYALIALVGVAAFKSVGTLLAVGLIIAPSAFAMIWVAKVRSRFILAAIFGIICVVFGTILGQIINLNASALIIMTMVAAIITSVFIKSYSK